MNTVITSREAILTASRKIATEQGLRAINMRAVAQNCGVAVGSVYNYFPSKADLVAATVEDIWKSIFHITRNYDKPNSFIDRVAWLFKSVRKGTDEYPTFFMIHSMSFAAGYKEKGRHVMNQYFDHMKAGLLETLKNDKNIRSNAFQGEFTPEHFVDFVFSSVIMLLMKNEKHCNFLLEIIRRSIY